MSQTTTATDLKTAHLAGQAFTIKQPLTGSNLSETLNLQTYDVGEPSESQVVIKFLAAPINPIDIHVLAGRYPVKPRHSINSEPVPGFDGVAKVIKVGKAVKSVEEGSLVVPKAYGLGTWRTHALVESGDVVTITAGTNPILASMLKTVIMPAYFLVEDMKKIEKDDWIIQNAGTSGIAQMVAQFAKLKGAKTISVIRDRPDDAASQQTKKDLEKFSDIVVEEKDFNPTEMAKDKKIVLVLDSVWGESARQILTAMGNGGVFVNYGQFGGGGPDSGIQITHRDIFWKGGTFRCFRSSAQAAQRNEQQMSDLLAWFVELFETKQLALPRSREVKWDAEKSDSLIAAVGDVARMDRNSSKPIFVFE